MIFLRVLILLLLLVLCPFLIGMLSFRFLPRNRQSVALTFVTGQLLSFALFEVIAVPCMLLNRYDSFVFTYRIYLVGMVVCTAFGARDLILRLRRVGVLQLLPTINSVIQKRPSCTGCCFLFCCFFSCICSLRRPLLTETTPIM